MEITNQVQCPHCGHRFELPLEPLEKQLIQAVRKLERHSGQASTQAVALELAFSPAYTRRQLVNLEKRGQLRRVGMRKGWKTAA